MHYTYINISAYIHTFLYACFDIFAYINICEYINNHESAFRNIYEDIHIYKSTYILTFVYLYRKIHS